MKTVSRLTYKRSTPGTHVYENRDDPYCRGVYVQKRDREKPQMIARVTIETFDPAEEMTDDAKTS